MVNRTIPQETADESVASESYRKTLDEVLDREKVIKKEWLDKTKDIYMIYEGGKADETPFNILYSNTEILVPNLFSAAPAPVVRRRFGETRADDASVAAERMAEYCMDTNLSGYPDFVDAVEACVMDAALPGQGQARIRLVGDKACIDYVQHDQFIWAYAKRWEDTPWIAYRHDKTLKDLYTEFDVAPETQARVVKPNSEGGSSSTKDKGPDTVALYEVWNKSDKTVRWLCEAFPDQFVAEEADPLGLSGFYPSGKPLRLLATPISTMPRPMYGLYRRQAEELNNVTLRIKRVTQAIKVRGLYDGGISELSSVFEAGDSENALVPILSPGAMARDGGLDKHIWLVPIEKLVQVLQQLFVIRDQIKSTIYEILGIGDILRGVSAASETASAQQIKDKWGSLRIKKSREKVSAFVRWHIRGLIELSAKQVSEETWAKVTGLQLMSSMEAAMLAMQQGPPRQGQPPAPPSWGQVLGILRDDLTRSYSIDIESNSTVDSAATEDREEVTEFMNALGQSMAAVQGLASQGPEGYAAAQSLLLSISKRFRMGQEFEKALLSMKPQPQGPTDEQKQMDQDLEKKRDEAEQAAEQAKAAGESVKQQLEQAKLQIQQHVDQVKAQEASLEKAAQDLEKERAGLEQLQIDIKNQMKEIDLAKQALKLEAQTHELKLQTTAEKVKAAHGQASNDIASKQVALKGEAVKIGEARTKATEDTSALVVKALQEQGKVLEALLKQLTKPVTIRKTAAGTFERS